MQWIVGDVHGCAFELERMLNEIAFDTGRDELWSAGDLINRGPDSAAALRMWVDVGGRGVLGNHDIYGIGVWHGMPRRPKGDNLDPLLAAPDRDRLMERLACLPLLAKVGRDLRKREVWLIHAGLHPNWNDPARSDADVVQRLAGDPRDPVWRESAGTRFATRVRYCTPHGRIATVGADGGCLDPVAQPWDVYYRGQGLIVHGHWAQRGHYRGERTMGLDSGCTYGGGLTAWCLDDDRIVQVPSRA